MAGLEGPLVEAGEAAGEGVLEVAAGKVLLEQADQEEAEQPECSVTENVAAKEQAAVDDEESGFPEGQDEQGETGDSPGQAGEESAELAAAAEAVDGVGASLDLRHDPGDEEHGEGNASAINPINGDISEAAFAAWERRMDLWPMRLHRNMAAKRAMKMSRLQPARRPSLPMKILWRVDGDEGGIGSGQGWIVIERLIVGLRCSTGFLRVSSVYAGKDAEVHQRSAAEHCSGTVVPVLDMKPKRDGLDAKNAGRPGSWRFQPGSGRPVLQRSSARLLHLVGPRGRL